METKTIDGKTLPYSCFGDQEGFKELAASGREYLLGAINTLEPLKANFEIDILEYALFLQIRQFMRITKEDGISKASIFVRSPLSDDDRPRA